MAGLDGVPVQTGRATALRVRLVNPVTIRGWNEVGLTGEEAHYTQCFSLQSDFTARWISES